MMTETHQKFAITRLQDILRQQRAVILFSDGLSHCGKIEQIYDGWVELVHDKKIILVSISSITSISYSL